MKDKERLFDQKIKEIKYVVEESDKKRKQDKEKVAEASKEYKRVTLFIFRSWRKSKVPMRNAFECCRHKIPITIAKSKRSKTFDCL